MINLILGTAEFNPNGYAGKACPSKQEIIKILNLAWEGGIRILDTAEAYSCELSELFWEFSQIYKHNDAFNPDGYYHYKQEETPITRRAASVYTLQQFEHTYGPVVVPVNINLTGFIPYLADYKPMYIRSVFDRGELLKQGYSVKDCLSFVKRHPNDGIIVGVNSVKELEQILKAV